MVNYWFIKGDFHNERSKRIGASDIPALIPNPENPTESLAGYGRTPVTLWQEKTGRKEREFAGLPAEMGHFLENKALELFIREKFDKDISKVFSENKIKYEFCGKHAMASDFQISPFQHNTQYYNTDDNSGMIAHPDCIVLSKEGPYLIEAKSANYFATIRRPGTFVKGYDFELNTWQGIPLKHYMQIQFQLALFEVDTCYLSLISNTSQHNVWEIKANEKHQNQIMELANNMIWHINNDKPPKELAINQTDIKELYPNLQKDFVMISGEERETAISIAKEYNKAHEQEKKWKMKKQETLDSMAVLLKDVPELRDEDGIIGKWQTRKGSEKILALKEIKKNKPEVYKYLQENELLNTSEDSRNVSIKWKGDL